MRNGTAGWGIARLQRIALLDWATDLLQERVSVQRAVVAVAARPVIAAPACVSQQLLRVKAVGCGGRGRRDDGKRLNKKWQRHERSDGRGEGREPEAAWPRRAPSGP